MNVIIWIFQVFIALVFLYSGISKSVYSEEQLVARGQSGVEGLSIKLIRFIGASELAGVVGIILPAWLDILPQTTVVASLCLGFIMLPAAIIHFGKREYGRLAFNLLVFVICMIIAYYRRKGV